MYLFYDTETVGFHGLPSLIQYAEDDGPVVLFYPWEVPIRETLSLLEWMMTQINVGFNLVFDHFQINKLYTVFWLAAQYLGDDAIPMDHVNEIGVLEEQARFVNLALKPKSALDLMLYSRKGPNQSLMRRKPVMIRKVPDKIAARVLKTLKKEITFDPIYRARWRFGEKIHDPGFRDILLEFRSSNSLKALAAFVLGKTDVLNYKEVMPTPPAELGYAPFALAVAKGPHWIAKKGKNRKFAWPMLMKYHHRHWKYNDLAIKYATDDVINTRDLFRHYEPEHGDDDSILACQVGAVRWRGYAIDIDRITDLRDKARDIHPKLTFVNSTEIVKKYIGEGMSDIEKMHALPDTKASTLEEIVKEFVGEEPAIRAKNVIEKRGAIKQVQLYNKLLHAGRLHPSFNIIGAKSGRMSGRDKLNPQGVNRDPFTRKSFTLADAPINIIGEDGVVHAEEGYELWGGDFDAFEVTLTDAVYEDPDLHAALKTGKKIHAMMASKMFPEFDYDTIVKNKNIPYQGTSSLYDLGKNGVFSLTYFGDWGTLVRKYNVAEENARQAYEGFLADHPVLAEKREDIVRRFTALTQERPGGKFTYKEPDDFISTMFDFRRYFTLENYIIKKLHELTGNIPDEWKVEGSCVRRERPQSLWGATMSALFAAACGLQGRNTRAAGNHIIQSPGATIIKRVQRKIWDEQPEGVHPYVVIPMNVHDEVLCPTSIPRRVEKVVNETVESFRPKVPLIKIGWARGENWGALK